MKRSQTTFAVFLLAVSLLALGESFEWGFRTRIFPMVAAIAASFFASMEVVALLTRREKTPKPTPATEPVTELAAVTPTGGMAMPDDPAVTPTGPFDPEDYAEDEPADLRVTAMFFGWLLLYGIGLWTFGLQIGGVVMTLIYMTLGRREKLLPTVLMAAFIGAMLWALDTYAGVRFPEPFPW